MPGAASGILRAALAPSVRTCVICRNSSNIYHVPRAPDVTSGYSQVAQKRRVILEHRSSSICAS